MRLTTIFAFLFFINLTVKGQNIIGVLDYMKVGDVAEYLEVEKMWQKIHEVRLKEGEIIGWGVYQIMYKTVEDPYNFVTVSFYDSFLKLNKGIPDHIYKAAYPDKSEDGWDEFHKQTAKSRKMLTSAIFEQKLSCTEELNPAGQFYVVNEIIVKPKTSKEYVAIKEEIYKPLYQEAIRNNTRVGWSLWAKWPGDTDDYQYISADGYISLDQIEEVNFLEYFNKIHPDKDFDLISEKIKEMRTMVKTELWKVEYRVIK